MDKVNNNNQIVYIPITEQAKTAIIAASKNRGILNRRTIMKGEGNISGFAGEYIVNKYLKGRGFKYVGDKIWDYDFESGSMKLDVKSKGNSVAPRINYDCTVPQNQRNQNCTHYVFVRINKDLTGGWINGWITKEEFTRIAKARNSGEAYNNAGRKTVEDHDVVLVSDLYPISMLM